MMRLNLHYHCPETALKLSLLVHFRKNQKQNVARGIGKPLLTNDSISRLSGKIVEWNRLINFDPLFWQTAFGKRRKDFGKWRKDLVNFGIVLG